MPAPCLGARDEGVEEMSKHTDTQQESEMKNTDAHDVEVIAMTTAVISLNFFIAAFITRSTLILIIAAILLGITVVVLAIIEMKRDYRAERAARKRMDKLAKACAAHGIKFTVLK